ncbi:MAG: hypothetical protein FWB71_01975 [Defluviitaleaceae bacterium]|nr:hypothetical protein [Defluviitaleaceae bacterium]
MKLHELGAGCDKCTNRLLIEMGRSNRICSKAEGNEVKMQCGSFFGNLRAGVCPKCKEHGLVFDPRAGVSDDGNILMGYGYEMDDEPVFRCPECDHKFSWSYYKL